VLPQPQPASKGHEHAYLHEQPQSAPSPGPKFGSHPSDLITQSEIQPSIPRRTLTLPPPSSRSQLTAKHASGSSIPPNEHANAVANLPKLPIPQLQLANVAHYDQVLAPTGVGKVDNQIAAVVPSSSNVNDSDRHYGSQLEHLPAQSPPKRMLPFSETIVPFTAMQGFASASPVYQLQTYDYHEIPEVAFKEAALHKIDLHTTDPRQLQHSLVQLLLHMKGIREVVIRPFGGDGGEAQLVVERIIGKSVEGEEVEVFRFRKGEKMWFHPWDTPLLLNGKYMRKQGPQVCQSLHVLCTHAHMLNSAVCR
jgi:hypothetical protein